MIRSAPNIYQSKGDPMKTKNKVPKTSRQPLKTLNILTTEQRKRPITSEDSSPVPNTPESLRKSYNLRKLVLSKEIQNSSRKNVNSPKSVSTPVINKKYESHLGNMTTPNTTVLPSPSSSCKRTPPLCKCGCRSTRKIVSMPGPNQGRSFFTCSKRKSLGMVKSTGCGFFRWDY